MKIMRVVFGLSALNPHWGKRTVRALAIRTKGPHSFSDLATEAASGVKTP
jgi:hypothetical protein